jgi:MscS family membrane protein
MDYLDEIYLHNPLRSYLFVVLAIFLIYLVKKYVAKLIASAAYLFIRKFAKGVDRQRFFTLIVKPLERFLFFVLAVLALERLVFPDLLNVPIYNVSSMIVVHSIIIGIIIFYFVKLLLSFIHFIAIVMEYRANATATASDNQLILFFRDFLKVVVIILGGVLVLKFCFGARIGELITGLSIVGAALALAAKESLENLIASFIIFFDKPFTVGDLVKVQNFTGFVERIGLRSTRLRTFDKNLVTVPNKQMVDSILDNWTLRTNQRMELRFELSPKTPSSVVQEMVEAIRSIVNARSSSIVTFTVYLTELSKNGAIIVAEYFTAPDFPHPEFMRLRQEIYLEAKHIFEDRGIELMGGTSPVTVVNEK